MQEADGMNHAPTGLARPGLRTGKLRFYPIGLDQDHVSEMQDGADYFGEAKLLVDNCAGVCHPDDWLPRHGRSAGRNIRLLPLESEPSTEGRWALDFVRAPAADHIFLANRGKERYISAEGRVGYPSHGQPILDLVNKTRNAMPQEHTFKAAEIALLAMKYARIITNEKAGL
ncbi:MAG TPA: hypothetical protein VMW69_04500 [Spirochaetia bacterium]|nr:hypothetical protein [Spirochaetia bacterium]